MTTKSKTIKHSRKRMNRATLRKVMKHARAKSRGSTMTSVVKPIQSPSSSHGPHEGSGTLRSGSEARLHLSDHGGGGASDGASAG